MIVGYYVIHTSVCTMFSTDILQYMVLLDSVCYRNHEKANLGLCIVEPKYKDGQLVGNKLNKVQININKYDWGIWKKAEPVHQ